MSLFNQAGSTASCGLARPASEDIVSSGRRMALAGHCAEHLPYLLIMLGFVATAYIVTAVSGQDVTARLSLSLIPSYVVAAAMATVGIMAIAASAMALIALLWMGERRLRGSVSRELEGAFAFLRVRITWRAAAGVFTVFALFPPVMTTYLNFKCSIPVFTALDWDPFFVAMDRTLHFGVDPWRIMHATISTAPLVAFFDFLYWLWFPLKPTVMALAGAAPWSRSRTQFLLTFFLVWIVLGTVMPMLMPAGGPVYYEGLVGEQGPYQPLMAYLLEVDATRTLTALRLQDLLWHAYQHPEAGVAFGGIAAMPSLHVAMPTLYTIAAFRFSRALGLCLAGYTFMIFLASVQLGWHYAVDGYASFVLVPLLWIVVGKLAALYEASSLRARISHSFQR